MADMKTSEGKNTSGSNKTSGNSSGDRPSIGVTGPTKASGQAKPDQADKGRSAMGDYLGYGDTTLDSLGNFIAGLFGLSEINPGTYGSTVPGQADWGFDPIGMGLGLAGSAFGIPGLGTAYGALGDLTGGATNDWGKVNLGPEVLGGFRGAAPSTPAGAGAIDRPSGSVQTSNGTPREAERGTIRGPRQPAPAGSTLLDVFKTGFGQRLPTSDLARAFTGVG